MRLFDLVGQAQFGFDADGFCINFDKNNLKMIADIITISSEVQSGTPVFAGTRVPIKNLFNYIRGGDTIAEFLHDFPSVKEEQVIGLMNKIETFIQR